MRFSQIFGYPIGEMPDTWMQELPSINFEPLRASHPDLANLAAYAEQYLHRDPESALVKLRNFAERMVDVANRVRNLYCGESDDAGAIDITLSTRSLKRWAALFMMFSQVEKPEHYALQRAVTNRASRETAKAIHDVVDLVFGVAA